jgi:hypothetical protein
MSRTITNKYDLYKPISEEDKVIFNIGNEQFIYLVHSNCLTGGDYCNDIIFERLGMNTAEKYAFASEQYGYSVNMGVWPASHDYDYEGLTNLVRALYDLIENKKKSPFKPLFSETDDISNEPNKIRVPKIKIKYIKGDTNSKLKFIK